jgi:hypothetical protein
MVFISQSSIVEPREIMECGCGEPPGYRTLIGHFLGAALRWLVRGHGRVSGDIGGVLVYRWHG